MRLLCVRLRSAGFSRDPVGTGQPATPLNSTKAGPACGTAVTSRRQPVAEIILKTQKTHAPYPAPLDGLVYPRFSGIPTFMRLPHITRPEELDVALVGVPFDGGTSYRLTVPAKAPVKLYWSATAYDRATHTLIRELPRYSRSSQSPGLQMNADGSVDIYFGPKAPLGKGPNWIPTRPSGEFEVLFRLYGPEKPLFDKTWTLPDIEKLR